MSDTKHVPDIMEVIADLSNDEVRTPPSVANMVLDLLPSEVWENPELRWLDPGSKSGVFLREATKRLMVGLTEVFPDEDKRLNHILVNQMFGISVTHISSLMTRRALYCSKDASGKNSITHLEHAEGNIWSTRGAHKFKNGRCSECGASQEEFGSLTKENHAYVFIHEHSRGNWEKEYPMKFDVIVGNPPYQMKGGGGGSNDSPLYNFFVEQAIKLNPRYIAMITPSRWFAGGRWLDNFREQMLTDHRISKIVDFPDAQDLFPQVDIEGGVNYFLWDREHKGSCEFVSVTEGVKTDAVTRDLSQYDILVRDEKTLAIIDKVISHSDFESFSELVSTRDPFGSILTSNFKGYRAGDNALKGDLKLYMNEGGKRVIRWIPAEKVNKNRQLINEWKVLVPKARGMQKPPDVVIGVPIISEPQSVCTLTYLVIGPVVSEQEAENLVSYLGTKFVRFMISLRKITQDSTKGTYLWVPRQSWTRKWTDDELFEKYALTEAEQKLIHSLIKEMA